MRKLLPTLLVSLLLAGCASTQYGYSPEEWNSMTQDERDEARMRAAGMMEQVHAKQREKEFLYQSVDVIFGSRSNVYGDRRNPY